MGKEEGEPRIVESSGSMELALILAAVLAISPTFEVVVLWNVVSDDDLLLKDAGPLTGSKLLT